MNFRKLDTCFFVLTMFLHPFGALAASFDCGKAVTKVERLICSDAAISKLDDELAATYRSALQNKTQAESIRQTQKQWLTERNGCADPSCVKQAYEARLHGLSSKSESVKQEAASLPAQTKPEVPQPHVDETACVAPKIDWRNYQWMLITGNSMEVCKDMLAYLKSRPSNAAPPTCPEERLPPNSNWTRPESRILSETEKQNLLRDVPERWRQKKPGEWVAYEQEIKSTKLLRVIRGDITRDGVPESFLAFNSNDDGWSCGKSKRCARPEEIFKKGIVLTSDAYSLLPMNDDGTLVNWSHRTVGFVPMLMGGELIFYKGLPYWMGGVSWSQNTHDDFAHYSSRADDPYSAIFALSEIWTGTGKRENDDDQNFKDVIAVAIQRDPERNEVCRLGYFHRDNLKQHPAKRRR